MALHPYEFESELAVHGVGKSRVIWYAVLFLPTAIQDKLAFPKRIRLRVVGEIADIPISGAWMPTGDGGYYFIVSPVVRKLAGLKIHDRVEMRFRIDDPERVEIPVLLSDALARDAACLAIWQGLTAGRKRGLSHTIHAAKTDATRMRRVCDVLDVLRMLYRTTDEVLAKS